MGRLNDGKDCHDLRIDQEFESIIPPLDEEEFQYLKASILHDKEIYHPIVVWNGIVIDGHHRYKILKENPDLKYRIDERNFANRHEAISWICLNQLGRRNLSVSMIETVYNMMVLDSDQLNVPRRDYQRDKEDEKVSEIVADWDERVANEPKVSYRDGQYFVFDGQHTVLAREAMNNRQKVPILCKVYEGLTAQEEALLFAKQTGRSSKPSSGEVLKANVFGRDPHTLAFVRATESVGLILDHTRTRYERHLACVNTAKHAYSVFGEKIYVEALKIIVDAWNGISDSLRFEIVKAVTEFVNLYYDDYNHERLVNRLQKVGPIMFRNYIICDVEHPKNKRYIHQIYKIYHRNGKKLLPIKH